MSLALLKLAATNRRELPTAAFLRLAPLAAALPPPWCTGPPHAPPPPDPVPARRAASDAPTAIEAAALHRRLADLQYAELVQRQALAPLRRRQAQALALQAVLPALAAAMPPTDERAARWLALLHDQVAEYLGPAAGAILALAEARRLGVLAEIAQLEAWS